MVFAVCVLSVGARVPDVVTGDPGTEEFNTVPSPVMATEVTVPEPLDGVAYTNVPPLTVGTCPVVPIGRLVSDPPPLAPTRISPLEMVRAAPVPP